MRSIQIQLTPAAGKRLIAKAVVRRADVQKALKDGKVLVIGGTTNTYVANELLKCLGKDPCVTFPAFHRGVSYGPDAKPVKAEQLGDLYIDHGEVIFRDALPEICAGMGQGDVIFKGANAVHVPSHTAAILIGNGATGGTIMEASRAVFSRRAKLILPVGLEKRVDTPVWELQELLNDPEGEGLRLTAAAGEAYTEIDAIKDLTGSTAVLAAAGGVCGGEGCVYLQVYGGDLEAVKALAAEVRHEPAVVC